MNHASRKGLGLGRRKIVKKEWDREGGGDVFTLSCGHKIRGIAPRPWVKFLYCAECEKNLIDVPEAPT